jgi:antibiotic biosynthesis monooxygenase (ABM) superfamily enzyme
MPTPKEVVTMSRSGGSARKHPLVMPLAIIAGVFVIVSLAAIVGPNWVGLYVLPAAVIVGVVCGAIILTMWVLGGWPDRLGYNWFRLVGREQDDRRPRS